MNREEAIDRIEDHMQVHKIGQYPHLLLKEALDMAIAALCAQQGPNDPLTLEELREMDGEPVWIVSLRLGDGCWNIADCHTNNGGLVAICEDRYCPFWFWMEYGITWLAYRRKPEEV